MNFANKINNTALSCASEGLFAIEQYARMGPLKRVEILEDDL